MKLGLEVRLFFIKHSKHILLIILCFLGIVGFVQYLNNEAKEKNKQKENLIVSNIVKNDNVLINNNMTNMGINNNVNTEEEIEDIYKENEKYTTLVKEFVSFCISGQTEKAYAMLSEKCKNEEYITIDVFKEYCNKMFNGDYSFKCILDNSLEHKYKVIFKRNDGYLEEVVNYYKIEEDILDNKIFISISNGDV